MDQHNEIILDLTGCRYLGEIHQRIKKSFLFPIITGKPGTHSWMRFVL